MREERVTVPPATITHMTGGRAAQYWYMQVSSSIATTTAAATTTTKTPLTTKDHACHAAAGLVIHTLVVACAIAALMTGTAVFQYCLSPGGAPGTRVVASAYASSAYYSVGHVPRGSALMVFLRAVAAATGALLQASTRVLVRVSSWLLFAVGGSLLHLL